MTFIMKHQSFLICGYYKAFYKTRKIIYIDNEDSHEFIRKNQELFKLNQVNSSAFFKKGMMCILDLLQLKRVVVKHNEKSGHFGSLLLVTRYQSYKIFDFKNNEVVNCIDDIIKYNNIKTAVSEFSAYFKTTAISFDDDTQVFYEKYIVNKPFRLWEREEIDRALSLSYQNYINYFKDVKNMESCLSVESLIQSSQDSIMDKEILHSMVSLIPEKNRNDFWPMARVQGDFNFSNILYDNLDFYFIDWEHSGVHLFFYDMINILFTEAYHKDYFYLEEYFNGRFDHYFTEVFMLFGKQFIEEEKMYYFALFLITRMVFFESRINVEMIDLICKEYNRVINEVLVMTKKKDRR